MAMGAAAGMARFASDLSPIKPRSPDSIHCLQDVKVIAAKIMAILAIKRIFIIPPYSKNLLKVHFHP
jgi:hypothetical protein